MTTQSYEKVLIIGGGLGGLALAQALKYKGIPFEIFERDAAPVGRKQGWSLSLIESVKALNGILPPDLYEKLPTISVNHNTGEYDDFAFVDVKTAKIAAKMGGTPIGTPGAFIRANREGLRRLLWESNNLPVSAGKQFTHYEEDKDGVTAYFKDGTSARGSLLIGADGLFSHVMTQLVGVSHEPALSTYVPLFGEVDLNPEQYKPYMEMANSGIIASGPAMRLMIGMLAMEDDHSSARFFWGFMPRTEEPQKLTDFVQHSTNQERYEYVMGHLQNMAPELVDIIRIGGPDAILPHQPQLKEFVTPEDVPAGRVTILGDAAHGMLPFRGAGANTALLDVVDLTKLLTQAQENGLDLATVVRPYLAKMIPRGREAVLSSRTSGSSIGDDAAANWSKFQRRQEGSEEK